MQNKIITKLNTNENWYLLLQRAKLNSGYNLHEELEHYLVMTLNNLNPESHDFNANVGIDFMRAITDQSSNYQKLRQVGDRCLLINGLFREISIRRNVNLSYYSGIGRQAYQAIAADNTSVNSQYINKRLFEDLSEHFVGLSDLIHTMLHLHHKTNMKN